MKKICAFLMATILIVLTGIPVHAAIPDYPVSPQYSIIEACDVDLIINRSSGVASCYASGYADGTYRVVIEYKLQRYMGSYWGTIKTWTSSGTSFASLEQTWAVSSGYTYRGHATCWVYDSAGNLLERGSVSKTYSYPSN